MILTYTAYIPEHEPKSDDEEDDDDEVLPTYSHWQPPQHCGIQPPNISNQLGMLAFLCGVRAHGVPRKTCTSTRPKQQQRPLVQATNRIESEKEKLSSAEAYCQSSIQLPVTASKFLIAVRPTETAVGLQNKAEDCGFGGPFSSFHRVPL